MTGTGGGALLFNSPLTSLNQPPLHLKKMVATKSLA
jgi:hypothetical protein